MEGAVTEKEHNPPTDRLLGGSISVKGWVGVRGGGAPIKRNTKDDYYMTRKIGWELLEVVEDGGREERGVLGWGRTERSTLLISNTGSLWETGGGALTHEGAQSTADPACDCLNE